MKKCKECGQPTVSPINKLCPACVAISIKSLGGGENWRIFRVRRRPDVKVIVVENVYYLQFLNKPVSGKTVFA